MSRYIARRLLQAIPTFFGITVLSFMMMALSGNPLAALVFDTRMTPEARARIAARLGVNDPWPVQYVRWLLGDDWLRWDENGDGVSDRAFLIALDADKDGQPDPPGTRRGVLRGDFGNSFLLKRPVLQLLFERVLVTLELSVTSLILGLVLGLILGILAAINRGGFFDNSTRLIAVLFNSIPIFWLGLLLLLFFASHLKILPLGDRCKLTLEAGCPPIYMRLEYMIMPVFVASIGLIAGLARLMRASMLDVIGQDFIRTARSKGLRERAVWFGHAARNALIPIATGLGPAITGIVSGSVIIEKVFNYPGLGTTLFTAATGRDYPVVMAAVLYGAFATITGYLLSDILYALIDPRIQFS